MLALCFEEMGMANLAINQYKKGLSSEGYDEIDYQKLRYNLGLLYERRGMMKDALQVYEEILSLDIEYEDVKSRVEMIKK